MVQQGSTRKKAVRDTVHLDFPRKAMEWVIDASIFEDIETHGNTKWIAKELVMLAVLWVWSEKSQLTAAFREAVVWSERLIGRAAVGSYQALTNALVTCGERLVPLLWSRLQRLMEEVGKEHWRIGIWLPLAVDGSRASTPRTKTNGEAFRAANYGKSNSAKYRKKNRKTKNKRKKNRVKAETVTPRIWLALLWHMGLRLPWCWKMGPSDSSEREHFREMLVQQSFPENTLFCGDAGFTGYDFWKSIMDQGHHFLIRVGTNVRLLAKLGYYARECNGIVYVWPDSAARKKQPPLILRLIHLKNDRGDIYLLTNVLNSRCLSDAMSSRLYTLRWGIELQFRTLKQTFGRRTLRSRTPDRAYAELEWSLLGLWMIHLFAVKEQVKVGEPPSQTSVAMAIQVVRSILFLWCEVPKEGADLWTQLQNAVTDSYERQSSKRARYRPHKKDVPSAGKPIITVANGKRKQQLERYRQHVANAA
ncbi:MAG: transposase [Pirellulales bacterium]|nr:transposase [Pirellulales bacterium]